MSMANHYPPEKKLLGLELLRFISALAILVFHYQHFAYVGYSKIDFHKDQQPLFPFLKWLYCYGELGVQLFWCISGFIFFWKYQNAIYQKAMRGKTFFLLRFSRLYPLHIATLMLMVMLQYIYLKEHGLYFLVPDNDLKHFVLQLFLASNWGGQGFSFNTPIWSISVEVLVYLFFFLVMRYVGKAFWITVIIILISVFIKLDHLTESFIVDCILYFYLGGFTAQILKASENTRLQKSLMFLCLFVIITPLCILDENTFEKIKNYFLVIYAPALIYASAIEFKASKNISKFIAALGNMTYSSYLIHLPLQLGTILLLGTLQIELKFYSVYFFILYLASVLILSRYIYILYEKPMQDLIRLKAGNLKSSS
jgi:peptidoglycan/LPS O-acetylase OafA/YrhL